MKKHLVMTVALMTFSGLALGFQGYDIDHNQDFKTDWDFEWDKKDKDKKDKKVKQPTKPEKPAKKDKKTKKK